MARIDTSVRSRTPIAAGRDGGRLRVLVLGGTRFAGRALVDAALEAGHQVTLFNRGQTNPELFPDVEKIKGDRMSDLPVLRGRQWDVVFDMAAYYPEAVHRAVNALGDVADQYVLVSTLSVYADQSRPHDEDWPLLELTDETSEDDLYGARKAACEAIVRDRFGQRALIPRVGMIVGPHDSTDRFTYWPRRLALGGTVLAPGHPSDPLQFIDVRDLARWMLSAVGQHLGGVFNVTGEILPIGGFLEACQLVTGSDVTVAWIPTEELLALGVDPWMGIPLWIGASEWAGANRVDIARARETGLDFRPLEEIIRDAWAWDRERRAIDGTVREGLRPEQERELLNRAGVR